MRFCKVCDCTEANNKCKECKYNSGECDYVWIEQIWKKNSN